MTYCKACGGEGTIEVPVYGYNEPPMDCDTTTTMCGDCNGSGLTEEEEDDNE